MGLLFLVALQGATTRMFEFSLSSEENQALTTTPSWPEFARSVNPKCTPFQILERIREDFHGQIFLADLRSIRPSSHRGSSRSSGRDAASYRLLALVAG